LYYPFKRWGEIVDVDLIRDKETGKSKGFAFIAYEDQRSTVLAVDNFNGTKVTNDILHFFLSCAISNLMIETSPLLFFVFIS